jgi:hypothetical protein
VFILVQAGRKGRMNQDRMSGSLLVQISNDQRQSGLEHTNPKPKCATQTSLLGRVNRGCQVSRIQFEKEQESRSCKGYKEGLFG